MRGVARTPPPRLAAQPCQCARTHAEFSSTAGLEPTAAAQGAQGQHRPPSRLARREGEAQSKSKRPQSRPAPGGNGRRGPEGASRQPGDRRGNTHAHNVMYRRPQAAGSPQTCTPVEEPKTNFAEVWPMLPISVEHGQLSAQFFPLTQFGQCCSDVRQNWRVSVDVGHLLSTLANIGPTKWSESASNPGRGFPTTFEHLLDNLGAVAGGNFSVRAADNYFA